MPKERMIETVESKAEQLLELGAVLEKGGVRFSAVVPQGEKASLLLYRAGEETPEAELPFPEKSVVGNIYTMKVTGFSWKEYEYNFKIDGVVTADPYAKRLSGRAAFGERDGRGVRCGFAFEKYDWKNDENPLIPYEDAVMYHLHVRNYTMNRRSGVRHKGTFAGLKEKIPYLKALGVNQVKLMPVYEFDECPAPNGAKAAHVPEIAGKNRMNCWGYGEGNYFAPKQAYAYGKDAVRECKNMIRAFHENGIEVLLDFYFTEGASLRLMTDCLLYWVREYHIDGFQIFGEENAGRLLAADPVFAKTKILNTYFPDNWQKKEGSGYRNCAELNDGFLSDMRRILKGDEGVLEQFAYRCRRNPQQFGVVNYLTNHDGFTLCDLVSYDVKHNEENGEGNEDGAVYNFSWNCGVEGETRRKQVLELRTRQMKNAVLLLMLSQGVPMLMAGDEFGNSQNGNNNPYCLDNEVSWVSWNRCAKGNAFMDFVTKAIAFRKSHGSFYGKEELKMMDYRACGYPDLSYHSKRAWYGGFEYSSRQLGMLYCNKEMEFLYVAYNFHPLEQELALPKLPEGMKWFKIVDTSCKESFLEEEHAVPNEKRTCLVPARSISVLIGREA